MSVCKRFIFLFVFALFSTVVYGAATDSTDAQVVNIATISTSIEQSTRELDGYPTQEYYHEDITSEDSIVSHFSADIDKQYTEFLEVALTEIAKTKFESISSNWAKNKTDINKELKRVEKKIEELTLHLVSLEEERKRWKSTLEERKGEETPPVLIQKIREILKRISKLEKQQNKVLTSYIDIETKWNKSAETINAVEKLLEEALTERSKQVFIQNAPAIWHVPSRDSAELANDTLSLISKLKVAIIDENAHTTSNFIAENRADFYLHLALILAILIIAYRYSKKPFEPTDDENKFLIETIYLVRERWYYSGIYLGLICSVLFYDYVPVLLVNVLVISCIILMIAIFQAHRDTRFVRVTLVLCGLYLLGQFSAASVYVGLAYRIFLVVKITLTTGALWMFLRGLVNISHLRGMQFWAKFSHLLAYGYGLLAVAFVGNILGYVQLANMLTLLIINVCVVSFLFYGIVINSNGLIALMLRTTWDPQEEDSINFRNTMERGFLKVVNILAFWFWIQSVLGSMGIYSYIADFIGSIVSTNIEVGTVNVSLKEIFYAVIVGVLTFILSRFIGIFITEGGLNKFEFKRGIPKAISLVVRYTVIFLGSMLALAVAGIDLSSFGLLAGALGIGIGFGLQNIISNFVAGLILVFERPLQEGDVVEVNSLMGIVKKIGIRSSNIRTYSGSEVVVPNETLIAKELINWTLSDSRKRIEILVGVDYGTDPRLVMDLLKQAALSYNEVLTDPAPTAYFRNFGDSALEFRLLFWVHHSVGLSSKSEVMVNITDLFNQNNINIPFPIRTLKVDNGVDINNTADPRSDADI